MAMNSRRPYYPATAEIERKEREFEAHYRELLDAVAEKHLKPETALEMILGDYRRLQSDPQITSECVYAGREQEFREAFYLAGQRAMLGMDDSATKSLAQLAEESVYEKPARVSWLVPIGVFAIAFGLSLVECNKNKASRQLEYRAPQEMRYHPEFRKDDVPKVPEKQQR